MKNHFIYALWSWTRLVTDFNSEDFTVLFVLFIGLCIEAIYFGLVPFVSNTFMLIYL